MYSKGNETIKCIIKSIHDWYSEVPEVVDENNICEEFIAPDKEVEDEDQYRC